MVLRIRLKRIGRKNKNFFSILVLNSRSSGSVFLERIGSYDPVGKRFDVKLERIKFYTERGAQISKSLFFILKKYSSKKESVL